MSAADLHRSVNDRIRLAAAARGVDANRLRRALVFHRLLARLAPHGLVLKGGFCLEARLPGRARATRDIDLVGQLAATNSAEGLLDALDELVRGGEDGFTFILIDAVRMRDEQVEHHAWRIDVQARLAGAPFERVKLDIVGQTTEVLGATEMIDVPPPVSLPGLGVVTVEAVDVYQHAAEKFHAYARIYAGDRPSSRVKDLVDLVLLIESGLVVDPARLGARLVVVHRARDGAPPRPHLDEPPGDWERPYRSSAHNLGLAATTVSAAHHLAADLYAVALERTRST